MAASVARCVAFLLLLALAGTSSAQLSTSFYSKSCPGVYDAVKSVMKSAIAKEKRMGASIVRLFFHDCFVQGCDASLLLDDTSSFQGEKMATPNNGSVRGFEVIDAIKSAVEKACPGVVSCADILAIAARDSVVTLGGPNWNVKVGRRDSTTASFSGANNNIPPPTSGLANLTSLFAAQGLSQKDMVALSGAHTIGLARCTNFRAHVYNETNIDSSFAKTRQSGCPSTSGSGDNNLAPLDLQTPTVFENNYYKNLVSKNGLLHSDQELFNGGATDSQVQSYGCDASLLLDDTPTFQGEKMATPNNGSVRGFEVIDAIKAAVEKVCPGVVSCADILAIAARDSVVILGGPSWDVKVGRRDSRTASFNGANNNIPPPTSGLANLTSLFAAQGLSQKDMVALSGGHTIGLARCTNFRAHIYNESNIDGFLAETRQSVCPRSSGSGDNNLAPLDLQTPTMFENDYYKNLVAKKGLLHSDQELFNGGATDAQVQSYATSQTSSSTLHILLLYTGLRENRIDQSMACASGTSSALLLLLLLTLAAGSTSSAQLSTSFYSESCPGVYHAVRSVMHSAIATDRRVGAFILRLFFHDCFVQGCDASLLLDDTPSFQGEKMATPNKGSARGFHVIDAIKSAVENVCPGVVSCADILAIAARDSVVILGGPSWDVKVGRRDSTTASFDGANDNIPPPTYDLANLTSSFAAQGLSQKDMVALAGGHTIGLARCTNFRAHIYDDTNVDVFLAGRRKLCCPRTSGSSDNNLAPLDLQTPTIFGNNYYENLVRKKGLLHSDQELFNGGATDAQVQSYVTSKSAFFEDFVTGMIKMGDIMPLTGSNGQIRKNCRRLN
ncbi:hypothetical protein EJB05_29978 [Eragrostis curvula]|uniref:Peroxidase 1 n=1 Tax=Eragrostis curvula TaxID=38414 RepID=A0A5J9UUF2_9POAL|nr:hypothetical protein EJB05_29978 [Eragrostis curvula]